MANSFWNTLVWLLVLQLVYITLHTSLEEIVKQYKTETSNARKSSSPSDFNKIAVFYNLFVQSEEDIERVSELVHSQFQWFNASLHEMVYVNSIGTPLPLISNYTNANSSNIVHRTKGDEVDTLEELWKFCNHSQNREKLVVYLHSKGSFHPSEDNDKLRQFLSRGALSTECASLPDTCTICSSRMSPVPRAHTSGNMWLAQCRYIQKLLSPTKYIHAMGHSRNPCHGTGRYAAEHWVHSHPSDHPCDLYTNPTYTWDYAGVPSIDELEDNLELQPAPRFSKRPYYTVRSVCVHSGPGVEDRIHEYQRLYHIDKPEDDWWGWDFFNLSATDYVSK